MARGCREAGCAQRPCRGRGDSSATTGHGVADEASDVLAVLRWLGAPVFLLGHSYGALCALLAAAEAPDRVARLILCEPPRPELVTPELREALERLAAGRSMPVLLQAGSESPAELFLTDALGAAMPSARVALLEAQAHEGMTTAPELYAAQVCGILLSS